MKNLCVKYNEYGIQKCALVLLLTAKIGYLVIGSLSRIHHYNATINYRCYSLIFHEVGTFNLIFRYF